MSRRTFVPSTRLSDVVGVPTCTSVGCASDVGPVARILAVADGTAAGGLASLRHVLAPDAGYAGVTTVVMEVGEGRSPQTDDRAAGTGQSRTPVSAGGTTRVELAPLGGCETPAECARTTQADIVLVPESWAQPGPWDRLRGHRVSASLRALLGATDLPVIVYGEDGSAWIANGTMAPR